MAVPPETAIIVSGVVSNGAFIGVAGWFAARWMKKVDENAKALAAKVDNSAVELAKERKADAKELADDLRATVLEHHLEIKDTTVELNKHLDKIYDQIRIANGRTAKLEGGLIKIEAVCYERHGNGGGK